MPHLTEVAQLADRLSRISPVHDSPIGLIHPYWARKPLNVVTEIVDTLSKPSAIVADPFVGSGTVALGALSMGRHAIATDINPLAVLIVEALVTLGKAPDLTLQRLRELIEKAQQSALLWYQVDSTWYIERERFAVLGDYAWGDFRLKPVEYVLKRFEDGSFRGRRVVSPSDITDEHLPCRNLVNSPIDFDELELIHNPRIAVPEGAKVSHFFTDRNKAFINLLVKTIDGLDTQDFIKPVLQVFLSSLLPLLRLSDRKASSQWPYWRPKSALTSRNPVVALKLRMSAFEEAAQWAATHLADIHVFRGASFYCEKRHPSMLLQNTPIQSIFEHGIQEESASLVLTDPPYSDQAPYLEYSEMSNQILGFSQPDLWSSEIVKTDAPARTHDTEAYLRRLAQGIRLSCDLVRPGGFLAFFYQDRLLAHWAGVWTAINGRGLVVLDVFGIPKQRRSMKTVTTPGRTFDGDLLVVCHKPLQNEAGGSGKRDSAPSGLSQTFELESVLRSATGASYFNRYAQFIRTLLVNGWAEEAAQHVTDVAEVLS